MQTLFSFKQVRKGRKRVDGKQKGESLIELRFYSTLRKDRHIVRQYTVGEDNSNANIVSGAYS
jgi:hypothetical protein